METQIIPQMLLPFLAGAEPSGSGSWLSKELKGIPSTFVPTFQLHDGAFLLYPFFQFNQHGKN
jgi:hypothetical protein